MVQSAQSSEIASQSLNFPQELDDYIVPFCLTATELKFVTTVATSGRVKFLTAVNILRKQHLLLHNLRGNMKTLCDRLVKV